MTIRFEREGDKFTAYATNGTTLHIEGSARRPRWAYVMAPGFGMGMLYNCTLRNVGDMRNLFRQLSAAEFVTRANARLS